MKPQHLFAAQACTLTVVLTLGGLAHAQAVAPVPTVGVTASSAAAAPTPVAAPVTAPAAAVVGSSAPGTTAPEAPVATGTVSPEPAAAPAVAESTAPLAPSAVAPVALTAPPATPPAAAPGHATPGRRSLIWQPHKAVPRVQEKPRYPLLPLFTLHAVANTVWNKDVGYDLFSDNDVGARFGVQLDADVVTLTPGLVVAAELGYTYEASSDGRVPTGLGVGASIEAHHPHVAALVNWSLLDWLAVHARAQAGLSFTHVEIEHFEVAAGSGALSSRTRNPFFALGAGLSVSSPPQRVSNQRKYINSIACGARLELGYVFSDAIEMEFPDRAASPPGQRLPVRGTDLGSLDRNGVLLGVSAFVRL